MIAGGSDGAARRTAADVRAGTVSAHEVALEHLRRAHEAAPLGALWHVDVEQTLSQAAAVDRARARREPLGILAGVPVVVKDAFDVRGMPTSAGGPSQIARRDAAAVRGLRGAGAVVIGKAAMHQLGWGTSGQTPGRIPCLNPRVEGAQPGGSSSGSAAAVAAGIVPMALGADTAGSVRVPAAFCGVVGYKPRQHWVGRRGLRPVAARFDTVGILGASVDDCRLAAQALGRGAVAPRCSPSGLRVALDQRAFERADADVRRACEELVAGLREHGVSFSEDARMPSGAPMGDVLAVEMTVAWEKVIDRSSFGADVLKGIAAGRSVSGPAYLRACAAITAARRGARLDADAIVGPTAPTTPVPLGTDDDIPFNTAFTRRYNVLDWPAISVPCAPGSTAGLQIAVPSRVDVLWSLAVAAEDVADRRFAGERLQEARP